MGFWSNLLSSLNRDSGSAVFTPRVEYLGASEFGAWANADVSSMTAGQMWATQPHFRTVVSFMARNIAQLGLHSFERVGESDRRRDRGSVLAQTLRSPDGVMTEFELKFALVGDLCLYDRAYWWAAPSSETASGWMLRRLPPTWVEPVMRNAWEVDHYKVFMSSDGQARKVPAESILAFPGYNPGRMVGSSPTVDALRQTLQEQVEAAAYRAQVWKRGGRVSAVLERPKDAPEWSDGAREAFREDWYAKYTGRGPKAGGTPILEDGMQLKRVDFSAHEQQYVEAAKLSLVTVASAFHINPTMVGQNEGANYSNVREFRKMLYGETLGPLIAQIEDRINTFLLPRMAMDPARFYVEFNIQEKLQGNFEEQAAVISTSVGRPWMTADEARGKFNLPALGGNAEELVTPLNVLVGGQASSRDSGSQNRNAAPARRVKARAPQAHEDQAARQVAAYFNRQGRSVLSRLGAGREDWWDGERWDRELADVLAGLYALTATASGRDALEKIGVDPEQYDEPRTLAFLRESARRSAESVNAATREQVESAAADDVAGVFEVAESSRALQVAATTVAFAAGFGTVEAARQQSQGATKTWRVNSGNPRPSHAAMDGETVGVDEDFSNGLPWPGAAGSDADEAAGCQCSVEINIP